jgi:DNA-binding SARP family transcriptional activator/tetratricopeptide (TPR) repeat protein
VLVREHRRERGLTQQALADRCALSVRAIRDIEAGRIRRPQPDSLRRLASALGLDGPDPWAARAGEVTGPVARVHVLGPLTLTRGGERVPLPRVADRTVLGLLALHPNRPVGREEIAAAIWGEEWPRTWTAQVHIAVSQLRQVLEPRRPARTAARYLRREGTGYLLAPDDDQLDLTRFRAAVARARACRDPSGAVGLLDAALGEWRGPVLSGADDRLRRHPTAVAVNAERVAAALLMADLAEAAGGYPAVVGHLREAVADEPFREVLHARLIAALARHGERAAALQLYDDVRRRLADELGVAPGPELSATHLRILRAEPVPAGASGQRGTVPALLPPDIADFTGRGAYLTTLTARLAPTPGTGAPKVAVISGMGGVGKTALAVHVAHRLAAAYPDGQLYVNLHGAGAGPVAPADVLAWFLRAHGIDPRAVPADLAERSAMLRTHLAHRRVLVVLDNAASEQQIRPLLPGSGSCAVLVTSRARLAGIEGASHVELDVFPPEQAVALLASITGADRVEAQAGDAAEIARLCGGLPLAVRVAGARLASRLTWPLARLARSLADERQRLDVLAAGDLEVRASLTLSYHGLDDAARDLLHRVALVDAPDFPLWFAAVLVGLPLDRAAHQVDALVDAQLLTEAGTDPLGQTRYRLHDLVRLYAWERAGRAMDAEAAAGTLVRGGAAWLAVAERMAPSVPGPCFAPIHGSTPRPLVDWAAGDLARVDPLRWFDAEHTNLLAAVHQACRHDQAELAFDLAGCLEKYFDVRGMYEHWRDTNERVMEVCRRAGHRRGEAVMLRGLIDVRTWNADGDGPAMSRLHTDACRLDAMFTELGEDAGTADAAVMCSWGLTARGAYPPAVDAARRALRLATTSGHLGGQARANVALALAHRESGRLDAAATCLRAALDQARVLGNARYEATVWQFLGIVSYDRGEYLASQRALDESLAICRRYRDHYVEVLSMVVLARVLLRLGDGRAAGTARAALELSRAYHMTHHQADALGVLGEIELAAARYPAAACYLEESVRLWHTRGWPSYEAAALVALGDAYAPTDPEAARSRRVRARELYAGLGNDANVRELTVLVDGYA